MDTWIEISKKNLQKNVKYIKGLCEKKKILSLGIVVKGNAYGHGLEIMGKLLSPLVDTLVVFTLKEAKNLRKISNLPILILGPVRWSEKILSECEKFHFQLLIFDQLHLKKIENISFNVCFHLFFDTGLGREGLQEKHLEKIKNSPDILNKISGIMTHYCDAASADIYNVQRKYFSKILVYFKKEINKYNWNVTTDASDALVTSSSIAPNHLARIGMMTYTSPHLVLTWKTKVKSIKTLKPGKSVGYLQLHTCVKKTTIAIIPVGYYDGIPRNCGLSKCNVLIHNVLCPIIGIVMMNWCVIDISAIQDKVQINDIVIIWGEGKAENAKIWANASGTIDYELLTRLPNHIHRKIV